MIFIWQLCIKPQDPAALGTPVGGESLKPPLFWCISLGMPLSYLCFEQRCLEGSHTLSFIAVNSGALSE